MFLSKSTFLGIHIWKIYPFFKNIGNIPICNIPIFLKKWVYFKTEIYPKKKPMPPTWYKAGWVPFSSQKLFQGQVIRLQVIFACKCPLPSSNNSGRSIFPLKRPPPTTNNTWGGLFCIYNAPSNLKHIRDGGPFRR